MQVAVTGGTGFLGQEIIGQLLNDGHRVRAWYRGDKPPPRSGLEWVKGELDSTQSAVDLVSGSDGVVHAALSRGNSGFMSHPSDPAAYYQTNVLGSLRLIEAAVAAKVGRFVFVSSGAVHERVADDLPLDERHPLWPASLYGASKAAVETLVHAYGLSERLAIATVRPVSIYGLENPVESSKWYGIIRATVRGERVDVSGGGKVVHVSDVAKACLLVLQSTPCQISGKTFPCCDRFVSHHEVASLAQRIRSSHAELKGEPKSPGREMSTESLAELGMKFGGTVKLESTIRQIIETHS